MLTVGEAYMMLLALMLCTNYFFTVDIGTLAIVTGCSSITSAGSLSFWRIRLTPLDAMLASKDVTFKTRIATKF